VHHRPFGASRSFLVELSVHVVGRGHDIIVGRMPPRTVAAPTTADVLLNAKLDHIFSATLPNRRPKAVPEIGLGAKSSERTAQPKVCMEKREKQGRFTKDIHAHVKSCRIAVQHRDP
jgi:hypothetical protein